MRRTGFTILLCTIICLLWVHPVAANEIIFNSTGEERTADDILQAVSLYENVNNGEIFDRLHYMEPIVRSYANNYNLAGETDTVDLLTTYLDSNYWNLFYVYTIYNAKNHGENFTYSMDEVSDVSYGMFDDFEGTLPRYPEWGGFSFQGDQVTVMPAQPEVQELSYVSHESDGNYGLNVVYQQTWYPNDPKWRDSYYIFVHMRPNWHMNFQSRYPLFYTVDRIVFTRDQDYLIRSEEGDDLGTDESESGLYAEENKSQPEYDPSQKLTLEDFLGSYYEYETGSEELAPELRNPYMMKLYFDEEGRLTRYSGMAYVTTGTTVYYPYIGYEITGNKIILWYETAVDYYGNSMYDPGTHTFIYDNGNLFEEDHVWILSGRSSEASTAQSGTSDEAGNDDSAEYIIYDSNSRYLTTEDLKGLGAEKLRLARNEIYARRGRMFISEDLQAYFSSKSWYRGIIPADSFDESILNDYERKNAYFIKAYEEELKD